VRFYACAAAAEEAGFRACRRCRPESAPGTPAWLGRSATVTRGLRLIFEGALDEHGVEGLAERLGIGSRHLRRLFAEHLGASPLSVARTRRVHFARRLIDETSLPMSELALGAGFQSVRQFNHAIQASFGRSPTQLRREARSEPRPASPRELRFRLAYRLPFDWDALLGFLRPRAIPGVEVVGEGSYRRTIELQGSPATIDVKPMPGAPQLLLQLGAPGATPLIPLVERVRRLFDLGADPLQIATDLSRDPELARKIRRRPGLRVPGAWDPFELCVRAILGQQVTVKGATTLSARLVRGFGRPVGSAGDGLTYLFPTPEALAEADLASLGMPRARGDTIRRLAATVARGELVLHAEDGLEGALERLQRLDGVGAWTAHYAAMRAFGEPDAFPAGDLVLRRALGNGAPLSAAALARRAEGWRPWRAYAAMWLWTDGQTAGASSPQRGAGESEDKEAGGSATRGRQRKRVRSMRPDASKWTPSRSRSRR
jgi:AraC family transcriptional regulator of adaptative response / DNA-3-methyladenine glycosylase II